MTDYTELGVSDLLLACGFKFDYSLNVQKSYSLAYAFNVVRTGTADEKFYYMTHPGRWPQSPHGWDDEGAWLKPKFWRGYLRGLISTAEGLGLTAAHVGPGLALYGAQTAARLRIQRLPVDPVSRLFLETDYTFEECMLLCATGMSLDALVVCASCCMPIDVVKQIIRGEQSLQIMLNLYGFEQLGDPEADLALLRATW